MQRAAERTPGFGRGVARGGLVRSEECVTRQLCSCRSQFTLCLDQVRNTFLLSRSSLKMAIFLFTDEAHFHLLGTTNKQNVR
jgi:hypothetical protein